MADNGKRRVTRREPIITEVEGPDGKDLTFAAHPLPWKLRIDFGDALVRMYSAQMQGLLAIPRDENGHVMAVESSLFEAGLDYPTLLMLAYPNMEQSKLDALDFDAIIGVLEAALEVNGLERLAVLLDPDRKKDLTTGAPAPPIALVTDDGSKMESDTASG